MTVNVTKPALNIREKLAELDKPSGIAGEAMLRADSVQEQRNLIGAGRKNLIINGAFQVSQRGDYTTATASANIYGLDRWRVDSNLSSSTMQQTSVDVPAIPVKSYAHKLVSSVSGTAYMGIRQRIEFPETYVGRVVTYSAYVRSNSSNTRLTCYVTGSAQLETSAPHSGNGQWERLSVTYTVAAGPLIWFCDVFMSTSGVGSVSITTGDYFEATGVQLELGSVATDFEHRSYGEELALCQRYFFASENQFQYVADEGGVKHYNFPSEMRSAPTVTMSSAPSGMTINRTRKHFATFNGATVNGDVTFTADAEL